MHPIDESEAQTYRDQFPIFDTTRYLNSCSLGPLSKASRTALSEYADAWSEFGAPAWWLRWLSKIETIRGLYAQAIGAGIDSVTIQHSISSALASVASAFDYTRRPRVVVSELDFPTIAYQWLGRQDVEVMFARSHDGISTPIEEYEALIDDRTALVATSHVFYATGAVQDIGGIVQLAHRHGAKVVVDGYHAVGAIPVDVAQLGMDYYLGGTLKWLCGGPGLTFVYVSEESRDNPDSTGWFAAKDQFAFETTRFEAAATADRFQFGTPSVATVYTGIPALEMMLEIGFDRINDRVRHLTSHVIERTQKLQMEVMTPSEESRRAGIVMLRSSNPDEVVKALAEHSITIDARPGKIRVSPHFFNLLLDVDDVVDALSDSMPHMSVTVH